ncbi:MAG TPA: YkoF family thiamine/hydroxymethylpyrimidine-binding protein [Gammaproteobacteria bacterium]|nr:YkoF family thiamine/hydroxymethylpyrimidine-binding protein [Gammaproteobacteria bacterium]
MRITAELSLYPLGTEAAIPAIVAFIKDVAADARVEVVVNQLSTQLRGELADVFDVVGKALGRSFAGGDKQVLVAKFLNVDLPIAEAPRLAALD